MAVLYAKTIRLSIRLRVRAMFTSIWHFLCNDLCIARLDLFAKAGESMAPLCVHSSCAFLSLFSPFLLVLLLLPLLRLGAVLELSRAISLLVLLVHMYSFRIYRACDRLQHGGPCVCQEPCVHMFLALRLAVHARAGQ